MLRLFFSGLFLLPFVAITSAQSNTEGSFMVNNKTREYIVHLPPGYSKDKALPLVLVFHGGGGNSKQMQRHLEMDEVADKEQFITVYPNGLNKNWNDGREVKEAITANDDVQFISQLLDSLQKMYAIDVQRVFSTGISNGGFFSIYLSLKLSSRLRAVAPVCASIPEKIYDNFNPVYPVSILFINGTEDPLVPYNGGDVGTKLLGSRGRCMSTDTSVKKYIQVTGSKTTPIIENIPDKNTRDKCTAVKYTYTGGRNNTTVCLIKITGGGHTAPGCGQYLPKFVVGKVCNDFNSNEMIWNFFKQTSQ
jgi:polyhydroxybutyrate depolymerase